MNVGKSVPADELLKDFVKNAPLGSVPSDTFGEPAKGHAHVDVESEVDYSPDPTETDRLIDTQNDPRFHPVTGQPLPPGREKNYLRMRSRIGRRR